LFTGQKGTGKTSAARIFAKSINCLNNFFGGKGKSVEPCNKCDSCKVIDSSSSPDVIEMDAASNRGIDEIRSLIKESVYSPMHQRYKVYIIDEAHMITTDAFNALLKTLEEPPESAIFILATTNEEKIPKTIVSRCIKIFFGRAKKEDIFHMIYRVAKEENLDIKPEVAKLIANNAEYSFRDATKILEDLVIQKKMAVEEVQKYFGLYSVGNLLKVIKEKGLTDSLQWVEGFVDSGGNVKNLLEVILSDLHRQLLMNNNVLSVDKDEFLDFSNKEISIMIKHFTDAYGLLRTVPLDFIALELALVDIYEKIKQ
jgi:DNA polymerase-3 subunit gamma/tau